VTDSVRVHWYLAHGDGTWPDTTMLFRDSCWEASARDQVPVQFAVDYAFNADSIIFWYMTNGAIDTIAVYVANDADYPTIADSLFLDAYFTTGWSTTTLTRVALAFDHTFAAGEQAAILFRDDLADANDRVLVQAIGIKGSRQ